MSVRICFVAAPLIARSGVYNSTIELVTAARARGWEWDALIGVSRDAAGAPSTLPGIREFEIEPSNLVGVYGLHRRLQRSATFMDADLIVTMVPQSDMALALSRTPWVAYLRGLPWPAPGESSRMKAVLWRTVERVALRRAREVWSTTKTLSSEVGRVVDRLVPPGLVPPAPVDGRDPSVSRDVVWAARFSEDKNPGLFLDAINGTDLHGVMYGTGPLEGQTREKAPDNVDVRGWRTREEVWARARAYVGTSSREAFGRSAVEAAMLGIPVVLSDAFGCADMLYTDDDLRDQLVLDITEPQRWRRTISRLLSDDDFHAHVASHVQANAARLTIESAVENVAAASQAVLAGRISAAGPSH